MKDQYLLDIQFAEELLQFLTVEGPLVFGFKTHWDPKPDIPESGKQIGVSLFHKEVGWSVLYTIEEKIDDIEKCFNDFSNEIIHETTNYIDDATFTRCALKVAPIYFSEGYSHGAFLGYCAMVLGVAYEFLYLKPNRIPHCACQAIALVLFMHQMTGGFYEEGGWQSLSRVASNFNDCIEDWRKK